MLRLLKRVAAPVAAAALFCLVPSALKANSIDVVSVTVTPAGGGQFTYDYNMLVSAAATVNPGDFFTIIDFNGLVPGTNTQPAGWTFSTVATWLPGGIMTTDGNTTTPTTDSPSIPDLVWTWNGPGNLGPGVSLGDFKVNSIQGLTTVGSEIGVDHSTLNPTKTSGNTDPAIVPAAIPLPATASTGLALMGGLGLLTGVNVLRRRRQMA